MFELTRELVDQIIFGMENQHNDYFLDLERKQVVSKEEVEEPDERRYLPLPEWRSVDGYTLMERFVGSLNNPIYRERLREVLSSGKGVFRQFKDTVKEKREIERLWYRFKEQEMRKYVVNWYNELRESWGLEPVDEEAIMETDDLVASDFHLAQESDPGRLEEVGQLDADAFAEFLPNASESFRDWLYEHYRAGVAEPGGRGSVVISAETPSEEFAGFAWGVVEAGSHEAAARESTEPDGTPRGSGAVGELLQLYVHPEYRGLGIASQLLERCIEALHRRGSSRLVVRLPGHARVLENLLQRVGFEELEASYVLDLDHWYREEHVQ
jgi:GNAT superfamily N-acetyltransferase